MEVLLELFQKLVGAAAIGGRARKREISLSLESATEGVNFRRRRKEGEPHKWGVPPYTIN